MYIVIKECRSKIIVGIRYKIDFNDMCATTRLMDIVKNKLHAHWNQGIWLSGGRATFNSIYMRNGT